MINNVSYVLHRFHAVILAYGIQFIGIFVIDHQTSDEPLRFSAFRQTFLFICLYI